MQSITRYLLTGVVLLLLSQTSFAQPDTSKTTMLETFGAISGILIYNTYVVIGTMADNYEGEVYDSTDVMSYVSEQIGAMQNLAGQYALLKDSGYLKDDGDLVFIDELIDACHLLADEATALSKYVESPTTDHATLFQDNRRKAWDKIAEILGID